MRLSTLLLVGGLLGLVFGIGFLLIPEQLLGAYGIRTDAHGLLMSRFFGAALVEIGFVFYLARKVGGDPVRRALVLGGLLGSIAGLSVALAGQLGGMVNSLGWTTVLIYGLLLIGFASFVFGRRRD